MTPPAESGRSKTFDHAIGTIYVKLFKLLRVDFHLKSFEHDNLCQLMQLNVCSCVRSVFAIDVNLYKLLKVDSPAGSLKHHNLY